MVAAVPLPSSRELDDTELTVVQSVHDGRSHLVDETHFAQETGSAWRAPQIRGLCEQVLLVGVLDTDLPGCPRCVDAAAPRRRVAAEQRAARERGGHRPGMLARAVHAVGLCEPSRASRGRHRAAASG